MYYRVIQLSDFHLGEEGSELFGVDGRKRFIEVLSAIKAFKPDALWLTGDFCAADPEKAIYPWVLDQIQKLNVPYYAIAGNHDDSVMLGQVFHPHSIKNRELYYRERLQGHFIVFLDTARGRMTDTQWHWLENELRHAHETIHIVMHHPPVYVGVPHMDNNHAFIEQERFKELMNHVDESVHIYCGHYHTARYLRAGNMHIHLAPSTLFQINPFKPEFALESTRAGVQIIDLQDDRVLTNIYWIENGSA